MKNIWTENKRIKSSSLRGFTRTELLVVISSIAFLMLILIPALGKAKALSKSAVCMINCKSLTNAWIEYAEENNDEIVSAYTGYSYYYNPLGKSPLICNNPWVGWAGYTNDTPENIAMQIQAVKQGKLYPYVESVDLYRCPSSADHVVRNFTIPDILGNKLIDGHSSLAGQPVIYKLSQLDSPSSRIVFLEEKSPTYGGFSIYYNQPSWWDRPAMLHNTGSTLGYADGHVKILKYRDQRTVSLASGTNNNMNQPDNIDLMTIQKGIFGSLGYW